ncbi:hypothetical protein KKI24_08320 [bacterium]|nr:hypothetical protein [bacterium]
MEKKIILWTQELATDIAWQDFQHREFLKFTNQLFDEFYTNKGYLDLDPSMPIRLSQAVGLEKHSLLGFFGH